MTSDQPARIGRGLWRGVYSSIVDHPDFQALTPYARLTLCWTEYAGLASALAALAPQLRPEVIAPVLTQKELAESLDVSTRTIRRRVKRGELPYGGARSVVSLLERAGTEQL